MHGDHVTDHMTRQPFVLVGFSVPVFVLGGTFHTLCYCGNKVESGWPHLSASLLCLSLSRTKLTIRSQKD